MKPQSNLLSEFESNLTRQLDILAPTSSSLRAAMKYSVLNGGKRIRPLFVLEASQLISLNHQSAMPCAMALEMVHAFSLVHDDLPSMDNDDFRRGMPTTHRKFGEGHALLAGDALLNFAIRTFMNCSQTSDPGSFVRAFELLTRSIDEMILGQSEELDLQDPGLDHLLRIQALKTGALFKASILCPLLLAGLDRLDPLFLECERYADAFGFAFQIADDLEDEAQDRIQGAKNILSLMGRDSAVEIARKKLEETAVSRQFSATHLLLQKLS